MTTEVATRLPDDLNGHRVYFVGIKGAGMSALAELFKELGADVSGVDTNEVFYTDVTLRNAGIRFYEGFDATHVSESIDLVVFSMAYNPATHPELIAAKQLRVPVLAYQEALGALSETMDSVGISGVHGKSTTTGLTGTVLDTLELPVSILAGAAISNFGGRPILYKGPRYFVAETSEYRRDFLSFRPNRIVVTSIELEHPDYFSDELDVIDAFESYAQLLRRDGEVIYCADDVGAATFAQRIKTTRSDITCIPYGTQADGAFRIHDIQSGEGRLEFMLGEVARPFRLRVPGLHNVANAAAAVAVAVSLCEDHHGQFTESDLAKSIDGIYAFRGATRRSEIVGERRGVLFMDDYGHHPTEIRTTLAGLKSYYPSRRLIVDFMPHLFSRTEMLLSEFVTAFDSADILVLHGIYASAREKTGRVTGRDLFDAIRAHRDNVTYFESIEDGEPAIASQLSSGDIFLTMGAGDNWQLGRRLMENTHE